MRGFPPIAPSLLQVIPLLLLYQLLVGLTGEFTPLDPLSPALWDFAGADFHGYLIWVFILSALFAAFILVRPQRRRLLGPSIMLPMQLECAIYALSLSSMIWLVLANLMSLSTSGVGSIVVTSAGAGLFEEFVFRLGAFAGGFWLLRQVLPDAVSFLVALAVSSVLFALSHHFGPGLEELGYEILAYRSLAGVAFGLVFYYRSLAHAVYTHFFYDLYAIGVWE